MAVSGRHDAPERAGQRSRMTPNTYAEQRRGPRRSRGSAASPSTMAAATASGSVAKGCGVHALGHPRVHEARAARPSPGHRGRAGGRRGPGRTRRGRPWRSRRRSWSCGPGCRRPTRGTTMVPWPCRRMRRAVARPAADRADVVGVDRVRGGERGRRRTSAWSPSTPKATSTRSMSPKRARTASSMTACVGGVVEGVEGARPRPSSAPRRRRLVGGRRRGARRVAHGEHDGAAPLVDQPARRSRGRSRRCRRARAPTGRRRGRHASAPPDAHVGRRETSDAVVSAAGDRRPRRRGRPVPMPRLRCHTPSVGSRSVPDFRVVSDFEPAGDQPEAIARAGRGHGTGRPVPDPARHHRLGQERHHRLDHRAGAAADAGASPPTSRWPPSWPTSSASSSPTTGSSTSSRYYDYYQPEAYMRLERHLHREGLVDQRRDRPAAPLGHRRRCSPGATSSWSPRCRASTASARPRSTETSCSSCGWARSTTSARSCASSSTCSTSATT